MEENYIEEAAATSSTLDKIEYDEKFILKRLMEGKIRDEIADELNHKNYRTIDMYMRRRGYIWNADKQIYTNKPNSKIEIDQCSPNLGKVQRIISLFDMGFEPMEIAKRAGMKDHRAMALYMKSKGYIWSPENQNYTLLKGNITPIASHKDIDDLTMEESYNHIEAENSTDFSDIDEDIIVSKNQMEKISSLLPMFEMINKNKEKLVELLSINSSCTIPRYMVGGITITKSLCMSHPLSELIKEFSKEKNISQREIFEIAIIEFLKKYGYENEINSLFS